ncbi:MAG: TIGR02206 family membrane protein [Propionibacteriaceae bacterium]|nr:TIGR02206 family membrane protein [Propionibacteriaceae bacterium]
MTDHWFDNFFTAPNAAPASLAFGQFTLAHLVTLAVLAVGVAALVWAYVKADTTRRRTMRLVVGISVLLLELVLRQGIFLALDMYTPDILPLHACAVVTFCVFIDSVKANSWTREFIYAVGTWGPLCAVIFPNWDQQPIFNLYTWQAFIIHALLFAYALMIIVSKEFRPSAKNLWKVVIIMAVFVTASIIVNTRLGTNFWFLNTGAPGSPLQPIQDLAGPAYLPVLAVLVAILWTIMYLPWRHRRGSGKRPSTSAS